MALGLDLEKNHIRNFILLAIWMILTYMFPNKFILTQPQEVQTTFIDHAIPLSSPWIWVYVSYYLFIFAPYLFSQNLMFRKMIFSSYMSAASISCLIFFAFPTSISRDLHPLEVNSFSDHALQFIRNADTSVNCVPSMHIALSLISTLTLALYNRKIGILAGFWFLMISYSTMATKQHYFYDVAAGAIFGFIFWYTSLIYLKKQKAI